MGDHNNADEILKAKIDQMGEELGRLHFELWGQLVWLFAIWQTYKDLYEKSEDQIALLNSAAPRFFFYNQGAMMDSVLLHICRITDPANSKSGENLTIRRIPELVEEENKRKEIEDLIQQVIEESQFARRLRNKKIAHLDLNVARGKVAVPLEMVTRENIEKTLDTMAIVLKTTEIAYGGNTVLYSMSSGFSDADSLVHWVKRGLKARQDELDHWKETSGDNNGENGDQDT